MSDQKFKSMHDTVEPLEINSLPVSANGVPRWWTRKNLRASNLWMLIPLLSIFCQG